MAQTDRQRWDARYRDGAYEQRGPGLALTYNSVLPLIAQPNLAFGHGHCLWARS